MPLLQVLEAELASHESAVAELSLRAQELISSGHFAAERVCEKKAELLAAWSSLTEQTVQRSKLLSDSHEAQQVAKLQWWFGYMKMCILTVSVL